MCTTVGNNNTFVCEHFFKATFITPLLCSEWEEFMGEEKGDTPLIHFQDAHILEYCAFLCSPYGSWWTLKAKRNAVSSRIYNRPSLYLYYYSQELEKEKPTARVISSRWVVEISSPFLFFAVGGKPWRELGLKINSTLLICSATGRLEFLCCIQLKFGAATAPAQDKGKLSPLLWLTPQQSQWVYSNLRHLKQMCTGTLRGAPAYQRCT